MESLKIQSTKSYKRFKLIESNRRVEPSKVALLEKSIKGLGYIKGRPVLVNEKFEIIDGQHRYYACQKLGIPVYYVVEPANGKSEDIMITLNEKQSNWTTLDYVKHWASKGIVEYKDVLDAYNTTGYKLDAVINLFSTSRRTDIRVGNLKRRNLDFHRTLDLFQDYRKLFDFAESGSFIGAFMDIIQSPNYNHKKHFPKVVKSRYECFQCAKKDQYLRMILDIINKGVSVNFFSLRS